MISVICTQCRARLEMDDAFAGGVCRCQYCGTIQTVPARLQGNSKVGATTAKTLYQKKQRVPGQPSSGLEDLADSVTTSSGLARGALKANRAARPAPPAPPPTRNLMPIFIAIIAALAIAVAVLVVMLLRR